MIGLVLDGMVKVDIALCTEYRNDLALMCWAIRFSLSNIRKSIDFFLCCEPLVDILGLELIGFWI